MSTHVPPFSQRFGMHPILTLQEAPVNPNAHVPVVEVVVETDVDVGGLVEVLVALLKVLLSVVLLETVVLVTLI